MYLTVPYSTIPYRTVPYHILQYLTVLYLTVQYLTAPYRTVPYHIVPYHTVPYRTVPYRTLQYVTVPYLTVQYLTAPYRTVPYHTVPYHTVPYHTVPYRTVTLPYQIYCTVCNETCRDAHVKSSGTKRVMSDSLTQQRQQLRVTVLCVQHQRKLWGEITERRKFCSYFAHAFMFVYVIMLHHGIILFIIWYHRTSILIYVTLIPVQIAFHLLHAQFSISQTVFFPLCSQPTRDWLQEFFCRRCTIPYPSCVATRIRGPVTSQARPASNGGLVFTEGGAGVKVFHKSWHRAGSKLLEGREWVEFGHWKETGVFVAL